MTLTKKTSVLALPLLLLGCGGGESGGGGGGTSPSYKTYTWQFVQLKSNTKANIQQACGTANVTLFSVDDSDANSSNWTYTYAVKAPETGDVTVNVFNSDGTVNNSSSLSKADIDPTNGTLSFSEKAIPTGGSIAVSHGNSVFAMDKAALSNALIAVKSVQGNQACYTNGILNLDSTPKTVTVSSAFDVDTTSIESYTDGKSTPNSTTIKSDITVLSATENVLLMGYTSSAVSGYKFVSKSEFGKTVQLLSADDLVTVDFTNSSSPAFNSMTLKALYGIDSFEWQTWNSSASSFSANAPLISSVDYSSLYEGTTDNGWSIEHYQTLSNSGYTSVDLTSLDNLSATDLALDCAAGVCELALDDITSDTILATKTQFQASGTYYTILSSDDIVVPNIDGLTYPDQTTSLTVSAFLSDSTANTLKQAFYVHGNTRDLTTSSLGNFTDVILAPANDRAHQQTLLSYDFTIATK